MIGHMGHPQGTYPYYISSYGYSHIWCRYYLELYNHHTNQVEFSYILEDT